MGINFLQSAYLYYGWNLILRYGFIMHDDYQEMFKTFTFTPGYALLLPVLTHASTLVIALIAWLLKNLLGYLLFWGFATRFEGVRFCRKCRLYLGGALGLLFYLMFAAGFFMNLYYLFALSYVVLFWCTLLL